MNENAGLNEDICKGGEQKLNEMLDSISNSNAMFKSQQIGETDLSTEDKRKVAEKLLFDNPVAFLARFGSYLTEDDLEFFQSFEDGDNNHEVEFLIKQLRSSLDSKVKAKMIRNRRFEALKRLESGGKYFSESEMEDREPLLYHQLVGQYLSEQEKAARLPTSESRSLSAILMRTAETEALNNVRLQQEEAELGETVSSDDETSLQSGKFVPPARWGADWDDEEAVRIQTQTKTFKKRGTKINITTDEKALLLHEFRTFMFTKFMDGLDADFDYSAVDSNPEYDCLLVRSQDEEDKYFDDETCDSVVASTDTGIEDY